MTIGNTLTPTTTLWASSPATYHGSPTACSDFESKLGSSLSAPAEETVRFDPLSALIPSDKTIPLDISAVNVFLENCRYPHTPKFNQYYADEMRETDSMSEYENDKRVLSPLSQALVTASKKNHLPIIQGILARWDSYTFEETDTIFEDISSGLYYASRYGFNDIVSELFAAAIFHYEIEEELEIVELEDKSKSIPTEVNRETTILNELTLDELGIFGKTRIESLVFDLFQVGCGIGDLNFIELAKTTRPIPEKVKIAGLEKAIICGHLAIAKDLYEEISSSEKEKILIKSFQLACEYSSFETIPWCYKLIPISYNLLDRGLVRISSTNNLTGVKWFIEKIKESKSTRPEDSKIVKKTLESALWDSLRTCFSLLSQEEKMAKCSIFTELLLSHNLVNTEKDSFKVGLTTIAKQAPFLIPWFLAEAEIKNLRISSSAIVNTALEAIERNSKEAFDFLKIEANKHPEFNQLALKRMQRYSRSWEL